MDWWHAVILGLVEGVTEYLPVSSTGHLILTSAILGLDDPERKSAVDAFNIIIQGGAILAVLGLYWPRVMQMLRGVLGKDDAGRRLFINIVVAFMPAAILGVLLEEYIDRWLFRPTPVVAALFLGGIWMIWLGRSRKKRLAANPDDQSELTIDQLTWPRALCIGLLQCVAMWPGTSRSMMTIAGGTLLGMRPKDAAEFSFLLGLPTLGGACVYKLGKNLLESRETGAANLFEQLGWSNVAIGFVVATISAAFAIRWLVAFLNHYGLAPFGWYRIKLSILFAVAILMGLVEFGA